MESIELEIDSLHMSDTEKSHLKDLAESHLHQVILDTILSELTSEDKKAFVSYINTLNHEKIWKFLNEKVVDAEEKIIKAAGLVKKELLEDIRKIKSDS